MNDRTMTVKAERSMRAHPTIFEIVDLVEKTMHDLSRQHSVESRLATRALDASAAGRRTILPENDAVEVPDTHVIAFPRQRRAPLIWTDPAARAS